MKRMTKNGSLNKKQSSDSFIDCAGIEFLGDRDGQEDYFLAEILPNGNGVLAILADGMGGHASGEIASQKAVEVFNKTYKEYPSESISAKLAAALQQANNEIANSIVSDPALEGMGCTLVGLHIGSEGLRWISVGDSPLFVYRNNNLHQINADHSMAPIIEESLKQGKITKEEAINHPHRNALRSAVMGGELTLIDTPATPFGLLAGDVVILASDGIMSLSGPELQSVLKAGKHKSSIQICESLIDAVKSKKRPRQDNTTSIVIKVPATMGALGSPSKLFRLLSLVIVLGLLGILAAYFLQNFNLNTLMDQSKNTPAKAIEVPQPVPVPVTQDVKESELTPSESTPSSNKSIPMASVDKHKIGDVNPKDRTKINTPKENAAVKSADNSTGKSGDGSTGKQVDQGAPSLPQAKGVSSGGSNSTSDPAAILNGAPTE